MELVKLTIIVPVFNTSKYLVKCIDSILIQSLQSIELILVNDASPDPKDDEICKHYAATDSRVKYFINATPDTSGPSSARNLGMSHATGAFLTFVDGDDWIKPKAYEKMYNAAITHGADTVQCGVMRIHDASQFDQPFTAYKKTTVLLGKAILDSVPLPNLPHINNTQTGVWNKIYKKSLLIDNNICFTKNAKIEDIEFTYKVAYFSNKSILMKDIFYQYYARESSIIGKFCTGITNDFVESFEATKKFLIEKKCFDVEFTNKFYRQYFEYISLYNKDIVRSNDKVGILKNILNLVYTDDFLKSADSDQIESILNPYINNKYKNFSRLSFVGKTNFLINYFTLKIHASITARIKNLKRNKHH